jgi:hypothetical protein
VDDVQPQVLVVVVSDAVVAEEVGVGGHDDPSRAKLGGREQRRVGRRRGGGSARQRSCAVVQLKPAGAVEARAVDAREQVAGIGLELGEHPVRRAVVVLVVRHRGVGDPDAEALEQLVEVVGVLVLLLLAEHDQAAAGAHERRDRVELGVAQQRRAARDGALPARVRRVGDDEHVDALERGRVERAGEVRRDRDIAPAKRLRRQEVRRILRMRRLHRVRDLGPDRPSLAVRLVEEDAGHRAACWHFRLLAPTVLRSIRGADATHRAVRAQGSQT